METSFSSLEELKAALNKAVSEALSSEVADVVREVEANAIDWEVYDAYPNPKYYDRRMDMMEPQNMPAEISNNGSEIVLTIKNTTPPNPEGPTYGWRGNQPHVNTNVNLAEVVESGDGYSWWANPFPRPFTQRTIDDLRSSQAHVKAMKKALAAKGIKTK